MSLDAWLLFCATETVLCVTPGPAVLLVMSTALRKGGRAGLFASLGILAANAFFFLLSATGLGALLLASPRGFKVITWAGAAYLIWLGARMVLSRGSELSLPDAAPRATAASPFIQGVITQGSNPKAIVFFSALLPQFVDPGASLAPQIALLAASSTLIELAVLSIYAALCHRARAITSRPALANVLDRAGGLLLIGAGAGLAAMR